MNMLAVEFWKLKSTYFKIAMTGKPASKLTRWLKNNLSFSFSKAVVLSIYRTLKLLHRTTDKRKTVLINDWPLIWVGGLTIHLDMQCNDIYNRSD